MDDETGDHSLRRRQYQANLGRFLSQDPIGYEAGDQNLYRYVENNPATLIDPSGLVGTCTRQGKTYQATSAAGSAEFYGYPCNVLGSRTNNYVRIGRIYPADKDRFKNIPQTVTRVVCVIRKGRDKNTPITLPADEVRREVSTLQWKPTSRQLDQIFATGGGFNLCDENDPNNAYQCSIGEQVDEGIDDLAAAACNVGDFFIEGLCDLLGECSSLRDKLLELIDQLGEGKDTVEAILNCVFGGISDGAELFLQTFDIDKVIETLKGYFNLDGIDLEGLLSGDLNAIFSALGLSCDSLVDLAWSEAKSLKCEKMGSIINFVGDIICEILANGNATQLIEKYKDVLGDITGQIEGMIKQFLEDIEENLGEKLEELIEKIIRQAIESLVGGVAKKIIDLIRAILENCDQAGCLIDFLSEAVRLAKEEPSNCRAKIAKMFCELLYSLLGPILDVLLKILAGTLADKIQGIIDSLREKIRDLVRSLIRKILKLICGKASGPAGGGITCAIGKDYPNEPKKPEKKPPGPGPGRPPGPRPTLPSFCGNCFAEDTVRLSSGKPVRHGDAKLHQRTDTFTDAERTLLGIRQNQVFDSTGRVAIHMRLEYDEINFVEVTLSRPAEWVSEQQARVGEKIYLNMPEMGSEGWATVLSITPAPPVEPGDGQVITGLFRHSQGRVYDLKVSTEETEIGVTEQHPFWSVEREDWIAACDLKEGEKLLTVSGITDVVSLVERESTEAVFNIEVDGDHVYRIGSTGILVHNYSENRITRNSSQYAEYAKPAAIVRESSGQNSLLFRGSKNLGKMKIQMGVLPEYIPPAGFEVNDNSGHTEKKLLDEAARKGLPGPCGLILEIFTERRPCSDRPGNCRTRIKNAEKKQQTAHNDMSKTITVYFIADSGTNAQFSLLFGYSELGLYRFYNPSLFTTDGEWTTS